MHRIRAQRELLRTLRDEEKIPPGAYRRFYRQAKGGMFRSRAHLLLNLRLAGVLPAGGPP
jgi:large subunit ribosomal protein L19e